LLHRAQGRDGGRLRVSRPPARFPARARPRSTPAERAAAPGPGGGADRRGPEGVGAGLPALSTGRRHRRRPSAGRETGAGAAGPGPRPHARDLDGGAAGGRGRAPGTALLAGALPSGRALVRSEPDRCIERRPRPPRAGGPAPDPRPDAAARPSLPGPRLIRRSFLTPGAPWR